MLCSECVNEFPLCLQNKGTGKKKKKKKEEVLGPEKDHETVQIGFLMILERKQSEIPFFLKKVHILVSVGTVISFRVEDGLASFCYP